MTVGPLQDIEELKAKLGASKTFCILPWIHLHVMPDSTTIPCCVAPYDDAFGDLKVSSMQKIWNSEKYKELRKAMLSGEFSSTCRHCYDVENSGFKSLRRSSWERFQKHVGFVSETQADGTLEKIDLKYVDVRFSNLCNFKCLGCSPALSSSWYEDHQVLFGYRSERPKVMNVSSDAPDFWEQFKPMVSGAEEIYFGGGEPLITKEHFEVLQYLIAEKKTNVALSYNTNLSTLTYGRWNLADLWAEFDSVTVGVSLDDIGPRAEYFRSGTNWNQIVSNLRTLKDKHPKVRRYVNCTISGLNALYLPELFEFLMQEGVIVKPQDFSFNLLLDPLDLTLQAMPAKIKSDISLKLRSFSRLLSVDPQRYGSVLAGIHNIEKFMLENDTSSAQLPLLRERLSKLDEIRKTSFQDVYPELESIYE